MAQNTTAKQPLGFLDLPPEIRLEIYDILLIARTHIARVPYKGGYIGGFSQALLYVHIDSNAGRNKPLSPDTITVSWPDVSKWTSELMPTTIAGLHPAILATCRTILREAAPILYGKSQFSFSLGELDLGRLDIPSRLKSAVERFYTFSAKHGRWPHNTPPALAGSEFAAFLLTIGPTNAALVTSLQLSSLEPVGFEDQLPIIIALVAHFCQGLRDVCVHLTDAREHMLGEVSPEYWHPDPDSPVWMNGDGRRMVRLLGAFVRGVGWLRDFKYEGQSRFPDIEDGRERIWKLEVEVRKRWEKAEEARAKARQD